jgi:RNA polymerase sigma-70 factor, ECF subfamily
MAVSFSAGDIVGSYKLVRHIHGGAFGQVWMGRHVLLDGYCALKVVPENGLGTIEMGGIRLYKTLAENHTGLIPVNEFGHVPSSCYFYTMPLADDVRGKAIVREADEYEAMTLQRCCDMHRPLPIDRALAVALHLLPSLHALHEAGFVHRDVKPGNVVLVGGTWKLCDMGLLARRDQIIGNSGTTWFMPPEGVKDRRADLYAFGKTLFLLTTDYPKGDFQAFMHGRLPVPGTDDRRDALQKLIQKACQDNPNQRFQTALEIYRAVMPLVHPTKMTIVLNDDFASWTPDKLEEFICAVREKGFTIRGVPECEEGSVRITLKLMPDEAERLAAAVRAGEFARFRAVRAEFGDSPPIEKATQPGIPTLEENSALHSLVLELFVTYRAKLLAMVKRRLDPSLAARIDPEDVLQEAFLEAQEHWRDLDQPATPPYAWLYAIVLKRLNVAWRRETRQRRDVRREMPWPESSSLSLGMGLLSLDSSPSVAASHKEEQEHLRRIMNQLTDSDKEILTMRHYDDLSFKEAAQVLRITENAATVRYVRALKRLKALWDSAEHPEEP